MQNISERDRDRAFLNSGRKDLAPWLAQYPELNRLEREFGKYLYIPFDIEPIVPADKEKFAHWYFKNAKVISKLKPDIAGGGTGVKLFRSIDSFTDTVLWETNPRDDLFIEFPELKDLIMQLPFNAIPYFQIWSSVCTISPHRDQRPWMDMPFSVRTLLYDENPGQTLRLIDSPTRNAKRTSTQTISVPVGTNTFAWNNIRTKHSSVFNPRYRKALMIYLAPVFNLKKLEQLFERSIAKYEQHCQITVNEPADYFELPII